jgi:CheY-like chemotaxis protein
MPASTDRLVQDLQHALQDLQQAMARAPDPSSLTSHRFAGWCVLVAEDEPANLMMLDAWLQRLGCTMRVARTGAQAVQHWAPGGVDLVLMDVQMPQTDGLQATQQIRQQEIRRGLPRTPIIAVTANALPGDREACLAAGMDGYRTKPLTLQALLQVMDEVLRLRSATEPLGSVGVPPRPAVVADYPLGANPIDLPALRHQLDGDETQVLQLAAALRSDLAGRLVALQRALDAQDRDRATPTPTASRARLPA